MSLPHSPAWRLEPLATMLMECKAAHSAEAKGERSRQTVFVALSMMLLDGRANGVGLLVNFLQHVEGETLGRATGFFLLRHKEQTPAAVQNQKLLSTEPPCLLIYHKST